jgi:beta-glucosidase
MSDWVSVYSDIGSATAGLDLEMPFAVWLTPEKLVPAVREGRLSEKVIDDKIRRLLRLALCFDWIGREQKFEEPGRNARNAQVALEVARESMVLLKNDGILPLDFATLGNLAVIGPTSHPAVIGGGGSCYSKGWRTVSFLDGIKALAPAGLVVNHAKGYDAAIADESYARSVFLAPDGQPGVLAEFFNSNDLSGPAVLSRRDERINHVWKDKEIAPEVNKKDFSIRFRSSFDINQDGNVDFYLHIWDGAARLSIDGVKVFDTWDREVFGDHCVAAELKAGRHELVLEFRNIRNWNSICLGWDCECRKAQEYRKALDLARKASAVVFCGGFDQRSEGEGADRGFALPAESEGLLRDVLDLNSRVVVVLTGGGNVDMAAWHDRCAAIIHAWFPGQEGGTALAEIISGAVNPSGRLPATFERRLEDRSSFDCYHDSDGDRRVSLNDGVFGGHRHFDRTGTAPRYPFGYGLSYTSFAYDRLSLSSHDVDFRDQTAMVTIHFDLTNTGLAAGAEVSQLYLSPPAGRIARPPKELKGFAKCHLEPGQRMRVALSLKARDFAWYDVDASGWRIEPGTYTVSIAASATDIRLTASVLVPAECLLSV